MLRPSQAKPSRVIAHWGDGVGDGACDGSGLAFDGSSAWGEVVSTSVYIRGFIRWWALGIQGKLVLATRPANIGELSQDNHASLQSALDAF